MVTLTMLVISFECRKVTSSLWASKLLYRSGVLASWVFVVFASENLMVFDSADMCHLVSAVDRSLRFDKVQ